MAGLQTIMEPSFACYLQALGTREGHTHKTHSSFPALRSSFLKSRRRVMPRLLQASVEFMTWRRTLVVTQKGYIGLGSRSVGVEDRICISEGSPSAFCASARGGFICSWSHGRTGNQGKHRVRRSLDSFDLKGLSCYSKSRRSSRKHADAQGWPLLLA